MVAQTAVTTQRIWGAFNPTTNQIVGVQISGETPYQNVPNALVAPTFAAARLATNAATQTIFVMGQLTVSDGKGGTFAYNAADTSSGAVVTATAAGTVLTVLSVQSGTVVIGNVVCSSITGAVVATIASFGTGVGGTGTYNLTAPLTQASQATFTLDNNLSPLVSADGSRWIDTETVGSFSALTLGQILSPDGLNALNITNTAYTFGNATDNPTYTFTGSGNTTLPKAVIGAATGGDQGAGTINLAGGVFINGVAAALSGWSIVTKPGNTTRNTTVIPANDPDLTFAIPAAGTYLFKMLIRSQQAGAGNIGHNTNVNFTGTITRSVMTQLGVIFSTPASGQISTVSATTTAVNFSQTVAGNGFDSPINVDGLLVAGSAGTLTFAWSQNTSSATNAQISAGSILMIQRIG